MTHEPTSLENEQVGKEAGDRARPSGAKRRTSQPGATSKTDFDAGRYLYCLVDVEEDRDLETVGIESEPVRLITNDGIGAVVHDCESVYDSDDHTEIHRWLVRHQSVTDEAAAVFGTPLPFQFATIIRGGDDVVCEWLENERDHIEDTLRSLADHWEYRIEIVRTDPIGEEALEASDDHLTELRADIEAAGPGKRYLLESKYEDRLEQLRGARNQALLTDVLTRLDAHAREVHPVDSPPGGALEGRRSRDNAGTSIGRLTILARADDEEAIGSVLDDVVDNPGLEVTFTGPWAPYSFTPAFGEETGEESDGD